MPSASNIRSRTRARKWNESNLLVYSAAKCDIDFHATELRVCGVYDRFQLIRWYRVCRMINDITVRSGALISLEKGCELKTLQIE